MTKELVYLSPSSPSVRAWGCFWGGGINSLAQPACCAWGAKCVPVARELPDKRIWRPTFESEVGMCRKGKDQGDMGRVCFTGRRCRGVAQVRAM